MTAEEKRKKQAKEVPRQVLDFQRERAKLEAKRTEEAVLIGVDVTVDIIPE